MKLNLTHLRLLVNNYQECFTFYHNILDFDVDWGDENTGYAEFNTGFFKLTLLKKEFINGVISNSHHPDDSEREDKAVLIVAVDDVDEVHKFLQANNVTIVAPPSDRPEWGIRTAHFRDPEGNLIEIYKNLA
jgi:lactoylglutathione lyase